MLELAVQRRQGDFSLEVAFSAGDGVTALFGPSGSGKTSVVEMVAGLARPDGGRIVVDGRVLFDAAEKIDLAPEARRLGYVFQEGRLFPHLSVKGNLCFGMARVPAGERQLSFDDVVGVLGIETLLGRRPGGLSGGEKQRVAIGRALLASPRILLMDEPLAALDGARKAEVLPFIAGVARRFAIPILYVSHAIDEVLQLADTLVLLDGGRVVAAGGVEQVLSDPSHKALTGRGEAGAVLSALVAGHDESTGITRLTFAGGILVVARQPLPVGTATRLRVHASDVAIAIDRPDRVSVQNILASVVKSVTEADDHLVDVMLDCSGTPLWAQITARAQSQLGLRPGMRVHAMIKAVTIARGDVAGR